MSKSERLYVHFLDHGEGRFTASLIPRWTSFFSPTPPSAHGQGKRETLNLLADECLDHFEKGQDSYPRYLWKETMTLSKVKVEIHPSTYVGSLEVLAMRKVPLWVTYGVVPLGGGGCRLVIPRFGDSIVVEHKSMAVDVIRQQLPAWLSGVQSRSLFDFRVYGEESVEPWRTPEALERRQRLRNRLGRKRDAFANLEAVAEEWVSRARRRRLDGVVDVFDPAEHEALMDRYPPASLLLVGSPGVGKSAWVRALAYHFVRWERDKGRDEPPRLWATSADRLMAGMSYLGQWEERCLNIARELDWEGHYLYVDRLVPILKRRGHSSIGDLWLEAVDEGRISLIAECSPEELQLCRRWNPSFVRSFRIIRLDEPAHRRLPQLLSRYTERRAKQIRLKERALRTSIHLLDVYQRHQVFPGKAFRFLDVLAQEAEAKKGEAAIKDPEIYSEAGVVRSFCNWTGLPEELISDRHGQSVEQVSGRLAEGVVGQPEACTAAARILTRFKAKVHDPGKPLGTLLFVGPTGVGKTELAKQVASYMFGSADRLLRFDMSEFQSPGSARRLSAVGRGTRSLAQGIRRQPLSLVLFDEIEKAHPEVFDLLLGVLGEGRLTDAEGSVVDFRMTVMVMTSNLGVREGGSVGFGDSRASAADYTQAVKRHFRPEMVNRLDEIVSFRHLTVDDVEQIVDLILDQAKRRPGFQRRNLRLHLEPDARRLLAEKGFHPTHGARPLKRLIEEKILTPLSVRISEEPDFRDRSIFLVADPETDVPDGSECWVVG